MVPVCAAAAGAMMNRAITHLKMFRNIMDPHRGTLNAWLEAAGAMRVNAVHSYDDGTNYRNNAPRASSACVRMFSTEGIQVADEQRCKLSHKGALPFVADRCK